MKQCLILLMIFSPLSLFGQKLKCCNTVKDVETFISAIWKEKDSNSDILYHYWFQNDKGHRTELKATDEDEVFEVVLDNPAKVKVKKSESGFELDYKGPTSNWVSKLIYLDSESMVLITNAIEVVYTKVSD